MRFFTSRKSHTPNSRLFYTSDIHGSDVCWRKFLNAADYYESRTLIMGGDLTGKAVVPVVRLQDGSVRAEVMGEERRARDAAEIDRLESAIRFNGFYPWRTTEDEFDAIAFDEDAQAELLELAMLEALRSWVQTADDRLAGRDVDVLVMPGNDDPWSVDEVLRQSRSLTVCHDLVVRVGDHEIVSVAWANPTPWNSPRELDEDELYRRIRNLTDTLEEPGQSILNLHAPPYGSGLDTAWELDDELRPVIQGGKPREIPVGSTAVRQVIEEVQPLLALHGHIHESRGMVRIGRTVAINPGSEYNTGRIHGCVVDLAPDHVLNHQLVSG